MLAPLACGVYSLWLGQDANWDLRNYHFYNPYALLHGRLMFDLAPAHQPTFYNPIPDLPFYFLMTAVPPRVTGFIIGAVQGLNFIVVLVIARRVLALAKPVWRDILAVAVAAVGMTGAITLSEFGTTFQDNMMSLLSLGALAGLIQCYRQLVEAPLGRAFAIVALLGLVSGLGVGLKQTNVIYAIGCCLALLTVTAGIQRRFLLAFVFGLGVLAGIAAGGGYWMWVLWKTFGNPIFPHMNNVFQSPWAVPDDYVNHFFLPNSPIEAAIFPYIFAFEPWKTAEVAFRDLRLPLLYTLAGAGLLLWPARRKWAVPGSQIADRHPANFLMAFAIISYIGWIRMFAIYRYLVPLEMLAPLLMLLIADRLALPRKVQAGVLAGLALIVAATFQPANWSRVAWAKDYFGVEVPAIPDPKNTIVVMTGTAPTAFVIPFFPPEISFLRIDGWFTGPSDRPHGHDREMHRRVDRHAGPIYVLYRSREDQARTIRVLGIYGLKLRDGGCVAMRPHIYVDDDALNFCTVDRQ